MQQAGTVMQQAVQVSSGWDHCDAHRSRIVVVVWIGAVLLLLRAIKSLDSRNRSRSFVLIPRGYIRNEIGRGRGEITSPHPS